MLLNGEGDFVPVLHVPLKFWASGFRIKLSRCTVHRVCLLKKDFVPEGKGTLCQRGSPMVMRVYQAYFSAILKKLKPKKLTLRPDQSS